MDKDSTESPAWQELVPPAKEVFDQLSKMPVYNETYLMLKHGDGDDAVAYPLQIAIEGGVVFLHGTLVADAVGNPLGKNLVGLMGRTFRLVEIDEDSHSATDGKTWHHDCCDDE